MSNLSFSFPHIEHKRYNITFLSSVKLTIVYDGVKETYEALRNLFKLYFKVNLSEKQFEIKNADALRLRDSESDVRFKFSRNLVEMIIDGDSYLDYKTSVKPFVENFRNHLSEIGASVFNMTLEKINLWPASPDIKAPNDKLLEVIFSNRLLTQPAENTENLRFCEFKDSQLNVSLVIKYGTIAMDSSNTVILDTVCNIPLEISADCLENTLTDMNDVLFDTYHWAVSEEVIKVMNK